MVGSNSRVLPTLILIKYAAEDLERLKPAVGTGASQGLAPRFEALQNRQVSKVAPWSKD